MDENKALEALNEIGTVTSRLILRPGSTEDDVRFVAGALMQAAEKIFLEIGGPLLAAAQFKDVADRLSASHH